MISSQFDLLQSQKNYYRNNLRRLTKFLFLCGLIILILVVVILFKFFTMPEPYYYATVSDGELVQLIDVPKGTGLADPVDSATLSGNQDFG